MTATSVIYVVGSFNQGGAESQLLLLLKELTSKTSLQAQIFVIEQQGALQSDYSSLGVPIYDGGYRTAMPLWRKLLQCCFIVFYLFIVLVRQRPSVVHAFLPLANLFAVFAGRLAFVPQIITSRRALNNHQDRVRGWKYLDIFTARFSHIVTANSEAVKQDTLRREGGDESKIRVIYNGIEFHNFEDSADLKSVARQQLNLEYDALVFTIVANLIPYKGHAELIEAFARILKEDPAACLLVIGEDRGIQASLQSRAEQLSINSEIRWMGLRDDIPFLLSATDIYVSASHEEGFSNSLLEALAAGKATIATNVGGNPEMLENADIGLLVEPRDEDSLFDAMVSLACNPQLRERLGSAARNTIRAKYSPDKMLKHYLEIYKANESS